MPGAFTVFNPQKFFQACAACLENPPARAEAPRAVLDFLHALGYLDPDAPDTGSPRDARFANRLALFALAARFDDAFLLPMPDAPGARFFGARVSPEGFGVSGHDPAGAAGRGFSLREAFEGCVGEAAEFLSFLEWDADPLQVPLPGAHGLSEPELAWAFEGIGLDCSAVPETAHWVRAQSVTDQRQVCFPFELILRRRLRARAGTREALSNGVGAGACRQAALRSGLTEIIERDAIALWWYGGRPARAVDLPQVCGPGLTDLMDRVRGASRRRVWFLDITTDFDIPVAAALSCEAEGRAVVAGFAADTAMDSAIKRAFLELCQMECAQQISVDKARDGAVETLSEQDRIWNRRFQALTLGDFPQLTPAGGAAARKPSPLPADAVPEDIAAHLEKSGYPVYAIELTRPSIGIPVLRVVAPGLQSVKPDWTSSRLADSAAAHGVDLGAAMGYISPI